MGSVMKSQGLAGVLEKLPENDAIQVVLLFALGTAEEKEQLAEAFERLEEEQKRCV